MTSGTFLSLNAPKKASELPTPSRLLIVGQDVPNRQLVLPLFESLCLLAMQQLRSARSVLETYRLEMVAWQKEMGNATGASRRTGPGKLATDDGSPPPGGPFSQ